jgi:hypothetical protein
MDQPNPAKVKKFWSIIINKIEISPTAQMGIRARVLGWFIYVIMRAGKNNRSLNYHYLTPRDRPFEFDVPSWFFEDKTVDKITARDVVNQFIRLMKVPVEVIPPRPLDLPWHKLPPSKRKEIISKLLKQQNADLIERPPDAEEEEN